MSTLRVHSSSASHPASVLDESARVRGWMALFLKHVLPEVLQRRNFHYKRKSDRLVRGGTVFLVDLAKQTKLPIAERKKEELISALADHIAMMPQSELPEAVIRHLPQEAWNRVKSRDARLAEDLAEATAGKTKEELMVSFQAFPKSFLEVIYHLRTCGMFPLESRTMVWVGNGVNSSIILCRANIIRALNKEDTSGWSLPEEFSVIDPSEPGWDSTEPYVSQTQQKRIFASTSSESTNINGSIKNSQMTDADLFMANISAFGSQSRARATSVETAEYWKHREAIERENAKRAKIDSEVHRFKTLEELLPTLEGDVRIPLEVELQKQREEFCRQLLVAGKEVQGDDDTVTDVTR